MHKKIIRSLDRAYPSSAITVFKHYLNSSRENQFIYRNDTPCNDKLHMFIEDAYILIDKFSDELTEQPNFKHPFRAIDNQTMKNGKGEPTVKKEKRFVQELTNTT